MTDIITAIPNRDGTYSPRIDRECGHKCRSQCEFPTAAKAIEWGAFLDRAECATCFFQKLAARRKPGQRRRDRRAA
jgi:hypothetical protein